MKQPNKPHKEYSTPDLHSAAIFIVFTPHKLVEQNYKIVVYAQGEDKTPIWCRIKGKLSAAEHLINTWYYHKHFRKK
jgi:hypothetical protein